MSPIPAPLLRHVLWFLPVHRRIYLRKVCSTWDGTTRSITDSLDFGTLVQHRAHFNQEYEMIGRLRVCTYVMVGIIGVNIRKVNFGKWKLDLSNFFMDLLSRNAPNLEVLEAPYCKLAPLFLTQFVRLRKVTVYGFYGFPDDCYRQAFIDFCNDSCLVLELNDHLSRDASFMNTVGKGVDEFKLSLPAASLRKVRFRDITTLPSEFDSSSLVYCPNLFEAITQCSLLEDLTISICHFSDEELYGLTGLRCFRRLRVDFDTDQSDGALEAILSDRSFSSALTHLVIQRREVKKMTRFKFFSNLKAVEQLVVKTDNGKLPQSLYHNLSALGNKLKYLSMRGEGTLSAICGVIRYLPLLETLSIKEFMRDPDPHRSSTEEPAPAPLADPSSAVFSGSVKSTSIKRFYISWDALSLGWSVAGLVSISPRLDILELLSYEALPRGSSCLKELHNLRVLHSLGGALSIEHLRHLPSDCPLEVLECYDPNIFAWLAIRAFPLKFFGVMHGGLGGAASFSDILAVARSSPTLEMLELDLLTMEIQFDDRLSQLMNSLPNLVLLSICEIEAISVDKIRVWLEERLCLTVDKNTKCVPKRMVLHMRCLKHEECDCVEQLGEIGKKTGVTVKGFGENDYFIKCYDFYDRIEFGTCEDKGRLK